MYETAVPGGERLDFAQNEDSKVPQEDERKGGYLEFLKQTSSLNIMTTPLMTMIPYQKKMVPSLNFLTKNSVSFPQHQEPEAGKW